MQSFLGGTPEEAAALARIGLDAWLASIGKKGRPRVA
jgi:hypothetical protein